jgi:hypothetical protein
MNCYEVNFLKSGSPTITVYYGAISPTTYYAFFGGTVTNFDSTYGPW